MAALAINRKVILMKRIFVLLFLIFMVSLPSTADLIRPETSEQDNAIVSPAYADDIDPNYIKTDDENSNIFDNYKNKTLHVFTAILLLLIIIASVSIRKSIKGNNNDNQNG